MGEYEIITSLARDFMDQGDSAYWASRNAIVEYRKALKDALEYECKSKECKKTRVDKRYKTKRNKLLIKVSKYKGTNRENVLVNEIASIMAEAGYLYGEELRDYVNGCVAIERNISYWIGSAGEDVMSNRTLFSKIDTEKVFKFLNKEVYRLEKLGSVTIC